MRRSSSGFLSRILLKEFAILYSVSNWLLLSVIVGITVGIAVGLFPKLLDLSTFFVSKHIPFYCFLLPLVLPTVRLLCHGILAKENIHSTDSVIESVHNNKPIGFTSLLKGFFGSILTIAFGGSLGKEAPAVDTGAGIGSTLGVILNSRDRTKLVICGIDACFAAVFGVPLSGAFFGAELLYIGTLFYEVLLPTIVSGVVAYHTSTLFGVGYFRYPIKFTPIFSNVFMVKVVIFGILSGLCSLVFIELLHFNAYFKSFSAGLGLDVVQKVLESGDVHWYDFQVLAFVKSAVIGIKTGCTLEEVEMKLRPERNLFILLLSR